MAAVRSVLPDAAVKRALEKKNFPGRLYLVAAGKAAWQMANAAKQQLGSAITDGVVITKYEHARGAIDGLRIFEAGHPVPDANSFSATQAAIELVRGLRADDTVLFLVSGGGSALFEKPAIGEGKLADITKQLLACGADIVEMNIIRKRLSLVKGGRFAQLCAPASVYSVILSDILGDPLDMIASGPAYPDSSTASDALAVVKKYGLKLSAKAMDCLREETPKRLDNVESVVTGSVRQLCAAAREECERRGIKAHVLTDGLCCTARDAGSFLASIARFNSDTAEPRVFIAGGETVVRLTGGGLGGRNQELALAAAPGVAGLPNVGILSIGSDGTDGPTDAAGGYVDGSTLGKLRAAGLDIFAVLADNDAYHALEKCGGLIKTGATGTNVNDLALVLIDKK